MSENRDSSHDKFICSLAQALHRSGSPAHEMEVLLYRLGEQLGMQIQGFSLPTMITLTIEAMEGSQVQRIHILRLPASDYNMLRLIKLKELIVKMDVSGDLEAAQSELDRIMAEPAAWGEKSFLFGSILLSSSVSLLFGSGWIEFFCSGLVGLSFVASYFFLIRWQRLVPILPFILCTFASIVTYSLCCVLPQQKPFITILSGIILIMPGFSITVALAELATMNLLSGAARLAGCFILMLMMGFGVAFGTQLSEALIPAAPLGTGALPPAWVIWPAVAVLGISLMAVVQAPIRSSFIGAAAALLAYGITVVLSGLLGGVGSCFASAFIVTVSGNIYQRITGKPAMLLIIPGLITLVPGSVGFRGLHALMTRDSIAGINTITDMAVTAAALAIGTLMANAIAPTIAKIRLDESLKVLSLR